MHFRSIGKIVLFGGFLLIVGTVTVVFCQVQLKKASCKPFWLDEAYALQASVRNPSVADLFLRGAPEQGSPSPLDYVFLKGLDSIHRQVNYFQLPPHSYYRLVSLASMIGLSLVVILTCWTTLCVKSPENLFIKELFVLSALVAFLLQPYSYHFTAEMRPYALWTALWLASAVSFFYTSRRGRVVSLIALTLLSITATVAVYQVIALALALFTVGLLEKRPLRELSKVMALVFVLPFGLALFYCLQIGKWEFPAEVCRWQQFLGFWYANKWILIINLIVITLCWARRETRGWAVPPLGMLILYLLGPAIFYVTKVKGFFFTERQFLYYETAVPICLLASAFLMSVYLKRLQNRQRLLVVIVAALVCVYGTICVTRRTIVQAERDWRQSQQCSGVPSDPNGILSGLLQKELPKGLCLTGTASRQSKTNLDLVAEWLPVHYRHLPMGLQVVILSPQGDGAEVTGLSETCTSGSFTHVIRP